jgi:hypothetical protein
MVGVVVVWVVSAFASLGLTLGLHVQLVPDVDLYLGSGIALYPSPLGTAVGSTLGYLGLAALHALAVGFLVVCVAHARPSRARLALAAPLLWWVAPLGVDAIAAALVLAGVVLGWRGLLLLAGGFHLAALPIAAATWLRSAPLIGALIVGTGALGLYLTPYGSSLPARLELVALGVPAALVVLLLGIAPALAGGYVSRPVLLGTAVVVLYATTAHVQSGIGFGLSVFAASRYALPLSLIALVLSAERRAERPTTAPIGGKGMLQRAYTVVGASLGLALAGLVLAPAAFAQTVPAVPVSTYGSSLLNSLATAIGQIFPYAAAITAFAIGVGMVKRWLGHRKATRI